MQFRTEISQLADALSAGISLDLMGFIVILALGAEEC
jgi:hypothetical protein